MNKRQKIRKGIILFSFLLFLAIFCYLSPVLIIQASSKGIINGSFIVCILMFMASLFLAEDIVAGFVQVQAARRPFFLPGIKK
jgi:hypothetical protein